MTATAYLRDIDLLMSEAPRACMIHPRGVVFRTTWSFFADLYPRRERAQQLIAHRPGRRGHVLDRHAFTPQHRARARAGVRDAGYVGTEHVHGHAPQRAGE